MKLRTLMSLAIGLTALAASACNTSSPGGSPGTGDSFKVTAPTMATTVRQGEKDTVKMSLSRNSDFKKSVTIDATVPKGLKVDLMSKKVAASDPADFSFMVEAEKDAPVGDHIIKITATPETGNATSVDVKIKVTEAPKT